MPLERVALGGAAALLCVALQGCGTDDPTPTPAPTPPAVAKVVVEYYGEAGCPFCQKFTKGALRLALNTPGIAEVMDLNIVPFGNALFSTPDSLCGVSDITSYNWSSPWDDYDPSKRQCFEKKCGAGVKDPPAACFASGKVYCQHGGVECAVNAIGACAKHVTKADWTKYGLVVSCLEDLYDMISQQNDSSVINASIGQCTKAWPASLRNKLTDCYYTQAVEMQVAMAKETPPHDGVPFVRLMNKTGEWMQYQDTSDSALLEDVCAAWRYNGGGAVGACQKVELDGPEPSLVLSL